jgi:hypothetical protein
MVQFAHTVARFVHSAVGELNSRRSRKIIGNSEIPEISLGGPTDLQRPAHFPTQNMQFRCVEAIREIAMRPMAHSDCQRIVRLCSDPSSGFPANATIHIRKS